MTRSIPAALAVTIVMMLGLSQARAGSLNLSTGLYSNGSVIGSGDVADANWTQSGNLRGVPAGAAKTVFPYNPDWYGGWVPNSTTSDWIAADPTNAYDNGIGTYSRTFYLTPSDVSTVALSGSWTLDDNGTLLLNGNQLATLGVGNWGALYGVSVAAGSSDFQLGLNTLSINLPSSDFVLEGARFDGSLSNYVPASAVPEPTTVVGLLSLGLMGALVCLWRFGRSWAASVRVA